MMLILAFILGLCLVATGHKPLVMVGFIMMLTSGVLLSINVLVSVLPLILLVLFPLLLVYALYKVLK